VKILYALISSAIVALAVLHMATTFRLSSSAAFKVWFFGAGMAMALAGALNLLNRKYGLDAFGLRVVCIGTNVLMICLAGIAGRVTGGSAAQQVVMLTVLTSALVLSALRSASICPEAARKMRVGS
jgi:peptidoglycan/LPS O-acetylase OafA/YrhL